jgi:hypothetical protein
MNQKRITFFFMAVGVLLVLGSFLLMSTTPAQAQCGSQASSCKNCHETQGQKPVNADGTAWHSQHSFGDFCYLCHGGNNQATDKAAAHNGMEAPLANIDASCKSCHPDDTAAKAQVYATVLGQQVGTGGAATSSNQPTTTAATPAASTSAMTTAVDMSDPNLVNYVQQYDEAVLGKEPTNWGNVILIAMIAMLALGGGGFVLLHEKLVKVSFGDTKPVAGEYPSDIVDLLPAIAKLQPKSRKSLKKVLENPKSTAKMLNMIDVLYSDEEKKE